MKAKKWYLSKSVWVGVLIVLGGIAEFWMGLPTGASVATIVAGVITVILRFVTKQSIK